MSEVCRARLRGSTAGSLGQTEALIRAFLAGQPIPGFASGGDHLGGLRIVGEQGPELQATGPARLWSASQTASMLSSGRLEQLVQALIDENRALRADLRASTGAIATNTAKSTSMLDRFERDGLLIRTETDPILTVAA